VVLRGETARELPARAVLGLGQRFTVAGHATLSAYSSAKLRYRIYEFLTDCSGLLEDRFAMVVDEGVCGFFLYMLVQFWREEETSKAS
jgi:hypothetical protein